MSQQGVAGTTYDAAMAAAYVAGRSLRSADINAWMTAARSYLPDESGRILDIGAGTGRFSMALAHACQATVIACEPSPAMREVCRASCLPEVGLVAGTAEAIPFADGVFDAVWASQVIHHLTDLPKFAHEVRRVLKPDGTFLLRGGFGPVARLPLYRYFPMAWPTESTHPPLPLITDLLAGVGLCQIAHLTVAQLFATDGNELLRKARTRSLSPLAGLPDSIFRDGLRKIEADVTRGTFPGPVTERLDLAVFRSHQAHFVPSRSPAHITYGAPESQ